MDQNFSKVFEELKKKSNVRLLKKIQQGLERECLRIDKNGRISQNPHPRKLGSALTNKYITTDFAEPQLELVTPAFYDIKETFKFLEYIHAFVAQNLEKETVWPFSMPPLLPKNDLNIPIADYGTSDLGRRKYLYRRGLTHHYGRKMQTISGIHYNFSFPEEFWDLLYKKLKPKMSRQDFISDCYFRIIRNFLRNRCMVSYFFGVSPVIDKSYLHKKPQDFLKKLDSETLYAPYGTSLRTSLIGYNSKVQSQIFISHNNLYEYVNDLGKAVSTVNPDYTKFGNDQLNDHYLQMEAEHYSAIRPKQIPENNETVREALQKRGVKYIEVRTVDISPFSPIGITEEQVLFLHTLLLYCLFEDSPKILGKDAHEIMDKQNEIALYGQKGICDQHAQEVIRKMLPLAEMLDQNFNDHRYVKNLKLQQAKIKDRSLIPAAQITKILKQKNYLEYGVELSQKYQKYFSKIRIPKKIKKMLLLEAENSLKKQRALEVESEMYLADYRHLEGSTQMIIKEALKRNIKVEVLDPAENFIRLSKGKKVEYLKQATFTSLDSQISYFIMGNKHVTKRILHEHGIRVPLGELYSEKEKALQDYPKFAKMKIVVKPKSTNYGISINFVNAHDQVGFKKAVENSFKYDSSILVEEFIPGNEYRVLVVGKKVVSVLYRRPASVLGDGKHTIKELVKLKNEDPLAYKNNTGQIIKLGETEKNKLKDQRLTVNSIPKKNERIFLRDNSNIHTGGDPIDLTDHMPEFYKKIALLCAKAVDVKICGVDMIIKNLRARSSKENYAIIEMNWNPAIQMHKFVVEGKGRSVEKDILDLLGF